MRTFSIVSLALLGREAVALAGTVGLPNRGKRGGCAHGRILQRVNYNSSLSPRQDDLLNFITERSSECSFGYKKCDGGCIPSEGSCCNSGRGDWCNPDRRCGPDGSCCERDDSDRCRGPGPECSDNEAVCNLTCMPDNAVCCNEGFYCDEGQECTRTGCIPEGAVTCGDGKYCGKGEGCGGTRCVPDEEEAFKIENGACNSGTACGHTHTITYTSSSTETSEAEPTATATDDSSDEPGGTATDSSPPDTDSPEKDDAAPSLRCGLGGLIVVAVSVVLLT
jgi:hypothetical protein